MDTAQIKNDHLYLNYTYYSPGVGYREAEDIVPVERIEKMVEVIGVRGGDHGWRIVQKGQTYGDPSFGKAHSGLLDAVKKLLSANGIETETMQEDGSGPCY